MDFEIRNQKCNQKSGSQPTWPGFLDSQRFIGCNGIDDCCAAQATWRQDAFMMRHGRTRCVDAPSREYLGGVLGKMNPEMTSIFFSNGLVQPPTSYESIRLIMHSCDWLC